MIMDRREKKTLTCSQVISISGDGKVLVWQMSPGSRDLKLVSGFILQTDSIPRSMRLSKARGDAEIGGMLHLYTLNSSSGRKGDATVPIGRNDTSNDYDNDNVTNQ